MTSSQKSKCSSAQIFPGANDVDKTISEANAEDYIDLLFPEGVLNLDALRKDEEAIVFVKAFFDTGDPWPQSAMAHRY